MIGTSTLGHQWRLLCSWALMLLWAHTLFSIGNWTREKTSCYLNNPLGQSLESFPSSFAAARSSSSRRRRTAAAASRWNSNRKRGPASYLRYISTSLYIENRVSMDFVMYASPLTLPIYARTNANAYSPTARARLLSFFSNGKSNQTLLLPLQNFCAHSSVYATLTFLEFGGFDNDDDARNSVRFLHIQKWKKWANPSI